MLQPGFRPPRQRACPRVQEIQEASPTHSCAGASSHAFGAAVPYPTILLIPGRPEPQLVPARKAWPISSTLATSPLATAARMVLSPTPKQAQITDPGSAMPSIDLPDN